MKNKSTTMKIQADMPIDDNKTIKNEIENNIPNEKMGILSVVGAVVLWSTSFAAIKIGLVGIPPITFAAIRFIVASILMSGLVLTGMQLESVPLKSLWKLVLGGLLGITAIFSLHNLGMQRTTSADANLLVASYPVIILLLEVLIFKEHVNVKQIAGVVIAICGVYLVINLTGEQSASNRLVGNLLILIAGFVWAFYNFVTKNVVSQYSTFTVIFWQTLFGMIALVALSFTEFNQWQLPSVTTLLAATFLGVFCSVGAYLLYGYGLKNLSPNLTVSLMNLQPVFGLILASILLGEKISLIQVVGGIILITGVTISIRFGLDNK